MLPISFGTVILYLHVLAATVWVGGQLTLLGLLPTIRTLGDDASTLVARQFGSFAWTAFFVLIASGIWTLLTIDIESTTNTYQATLGWKLLLVTASGIGAAVHSTARSPAGVAAGGAVGLVGALGALFLGVVLQGG